MTPLILALDWRDCIEIDRARRFYWLVLINWTVRTCSHCYSNAVNLFQSRLSRQGNGGIKFLSQSQMLKIAVMVIADGYSDWRKLLALQFWGRVRQLVSGASMWQRSHPLSLSSPPSRLNELAVCFGRVSGCCLNGQRLALSMWIVIAIRRLTLAIGSFLSTGDGSVVVVCPTGGTGE